MKPYFIATVIFTLSVIANTITFSQTPDNTGSLFPNRNAAQHEWITKPIDLPAENFELVSADGRKITVTVLSKDDKGITIRKTDGWEGVVQRSQLNIKTDEKIWGVVGNTSPKNDGPPRMNMFKSKDPVEQQKEMVESNKLFFKYWDEKVASTPVEKRIKELYKEAAPYIIKRGEAVAALTTQKEISGAYTWGSEFNGINQGPSKRPPTPAAELMQRLKDPADSIHIRVTLRADSALMKIRNMEKDPEWEKYNITPWDLLSTLEIKTGPEKVSLRPKFKELGVHAVKQIGNTCELYSTNHLLQFSCKSAGITPPTLETIRTACGKPAPSGSYFTHKLNFKELCGKRPIVTRINIQNDGKSYPWTLQWELAKHELRNGRPVRANFGEHAVIATGFETDEAGKTTWEYINSNRVDENEGFHTTDAINPEFSIYFEKE